MKAATLLAACSAALCFQPVAAAQAYDIEVIAMVGMPVPGLPDNFVYMDEFQRFELNDQGDVLFRAIVVDELDAAYYAEAIMRKLSGSDVKLLARDTDTASGVLGNVYYTTFYEQSLRQNGECVFSANIEGLYDSHDSALFTVYPESNFGFLLGDHEHAPGLPANARFGHFRSARLTALDHGTNGLAMTSRVLNNTNQTQFAAFAPSDGEPFTAVAELGATPPGLPVDVHYYRLFLPTVNSVGQGVLGARLAGEGVSKPNDTLLLRTDPDAPPSVFLRAGQQAPSLAEGVIYNSVYEPTINDLGQIGFHALLEGPGVDGTNDYGYFAVTPESVHHTVAREGDIAPHFPGDDEARIESLYHVHFNKSGQYAFHANLETNSIDPYMGGAIYRGSLGSDPQLLVRAGEQAADFQMGVTYRAFYSRNGTRFSNNGRVAFLASCEHTHPLADDIDAIFAVSLDGTVRRVFKPGYRFYTDPDPALNKYEIVSWISKPLAINNAGQVLFMAHIRSGTMLILATPNPCPPDINGDGMLSPTDFTAWINAFHNMAPNCDQNADGACNTSDFTAWITNYNIGC